MSAPTIQRPYTPLFLRLAEQSNALVKHMDKEVAEHIRVAVDYEASAVWQCTSPHEIIAHIDWDNGCLTLSWAESDPAWSEGDPVRADWSPEYRQDFPELKQAALAEEQPRAWFESHALHLLAIVQDHQVKVRPQRSTGETHYERLLIYALGLAHHPQPFWVGDAIFTYDGRCERAE